MKKLFVAMMALCAMALTFAGCDNDSLMQANPETQPIAGKTFKGDLATRDGYAQLTFHMNYKCTLQTKRDSDLSPSINPNFTWYMAVDGSNEVTVRYAQGAYNKETLESLSNQLFLSGTYNPANKSVTLTYEPTHETTYVLYEQ